MICQLRDELHALRYDLFQMSTKILFMFLWYLTAVVRDPVTLGCHHHFCARLLSQGCGILGNQTPSDEGDRDESRYMCFTSLCHAGGHRQCVISDCPPCHFSPLQDISGSFLLPFLKTKIILLKEEAKTAWACVVKHAVCPMGRQP